MTAITVIIHTLGAFV